MTDAHGPRIAGARIGFIFISVRDLLSMTAFYRQMLGFDVVYQDESSVFLSLPGQSQPQIALTAGRAASEAAAPHWFIVIETIDLASARETMLDAGLHVSGIAAVPYGRAVALHDPEGNMIEIHEAEGTAAASS